jgi:putative ABC transport system ATP-binding protein
MAFIVFDRVSKIYKLGKVNVPALQDVSLQVNKGEFITVMGPSGSGKSTLLNILGLLDVPNAGQVLLQDHVLDFRNDRILTRIRRNQIGFIFQNFNLIPILTVYENVGYPLLNSSVSLHERRIRILSLLESVGLEGLEKRFPNELSGGQRQRVAIARAFVRQPEIILADEPTANLDSATGALIVDLMHRMNQEQGTTFIMATHDADLIQRSDLVFKIRDGRLETHENSL